MRPKPLHFLVGRHFCLVLAFTILSTIGLGDALCAQTIQYTYDSLERLTRVAYPDGSSIDYVYDSAGNRLMEARNLPGQQPNQPPPAVGAPGIPNGAVNVNSTPLLTWQSVTDPDPADAVVYFVYFGTAQTRQLVYSGFGTSWSPGQLGCFSSYSWNVVARDSRNAQTAGPVWAFTTGDVPPRPEFSADPVSGLAPLTVTFQDQSRYDCGVVSAWQWDFNNDGQIDSTNRIGTYRYTTPGDYSVKLIVTGEHGGISTLVKTNFISALGANIVDLSPLDLRIESAGPNQNLLVSYLVTNNGTVSLSGKWQWADGFYVSQEPAWDSTATQVGSVLEALALPRGVSYRRTNMVSLSSINPAGKYLYLRADNGANIPEISENNNTLSIFVATALPDLIVGTVRVEGQPVSGQFVEVVYSVTNRGSLDIRALSGAGVDFEQTFYLSTNAFWDKTATPIGYDIFSGVLAVGGSFTRTNRVFLPARATGNYFLLVRVNDPDTVLESNRSNNLVAVPLAMSTPDLAVLSMVAPSRAASDERIEIVYTVTNRGSAPALGTWFDSFYLSTNSVWNENAFDLANGIQSGPIPVAGSYRATNSFRLPGWPPGTYYLFMRTDAWGLLSEQVTDNNSRSAVITLTSPSGLPDLKPTFLNAPDFATVGSRIEVSYGATNVGGSPMTAAYWLDIVWLAVTPLADPESDMILANQILGPLASRAAYHRTNEVSLSNVLPGQYYLILETDFAGLADELTTTNNSLVRPLLVTPAGIPDLAVQSLTGPASAAPGQVIRVSYAVTNQGGPLSAAFWSDALSLSRDNVVGGADDITLTNISVQFSLLIAGGTYTRTADLTLPEFPVGSYYVGLKLDSTGNLNEGSTANNMRVTPISLGLQPSPVRFISIQVKPNNTLQLEIEAEVGKTYTLLHSADLANWQVLSPWTCTNSPARVLIPVTAPAAPRFYRLAY